MRLNGRSAILDLLRGLRWLEDVMKGELGASDPMTVNDSCVLSRWLDLLLVKLLLLLLLLAELLFVIDELHAVLASPLLKFAFQS